MPELPNKKQELFCQKYCVLHKTQEGGKFNGTQAAREAGYAKGSAAVTASRLLRKANIRRRVEELIAERVEQMAVDSKRVLKELGCIGTVDIGQAFDANGNLLPIHKIPEDVRRAIAGFELVEERDENGEPTGHMTKKVKFWDKNTSLLGLAKVFKMLTDKVEVKHQVTLENFLGGTWPDEDQKGKSPKDKKK